jgi:hypothetical protein
MTKVLITLVSKLVSYEKGVGSEFTYIKPKTKVGQLYYEILKYEKKRERVKGSTTTSFLTFKAVFFFKERRLDTEHNMCIRQILC